MVKKMATPTPKRGEVWLVDSGHGRQDSTVLGFGAFQQPIKNDRVRRHLLRIQPAREDPGSKL